MRYPLLILLLVLPCVADAQIVLNGPTTQWNSFSWSLAGQADYFDDQQTGLPEGDLVGSDLVGSTLFNPLAFWQYDGTNWGFRVRVGASLPQAGTFDHNLFFGYDSNLDGALDGFFGVDNSGGTDRLRIWATDGGLNTAPSNTGVGSSIFEYVQDSNNYSFVPVDALNDPLATSLDIDGDGNNDYFVNFLIPASDMPFGPTDSIQYVLATSTQPNSFNQDIGGLQGGLNSPTPWSTNGGFTDPIVGVPEPSSWALVGLAAAGLYWMRRKKVPKAA